MQPKFCIIFSSTLLYIDDSNDVFAMKILISLFLCKGSVHEDVFSFFYGEYDVCCNKVDVMFMKFLL